MTWPWLLALAALLLPFDVAARRLILTRQDMIRLKEWFATRTSIRKRTIVKPEQRSQRMDMLFQAKDRAHGEKMPPPIEPLHGIPSEPSKIAEPEKVETSEVEPVSSRKESPFRESIPSTTEALLARKKSIRKKSD